MTQAGQAAVEEQIVYLKVADVHPSNNYRKSMDKGKFEELKASIKERGVQTPIWVRKNGKGWLIVAGGRRHQASVELKLETIPAIVKDVTTDYDALILSVIENDQREDVNPMEQAEAYQNALNQGKHTPETLAEKLGYKLPYILGRLKLLKISKKAQKALKDGEIEYGHALLISRLKDHKDQDDFLDTILTEEWDRKLSVKEAEEYLNNFSTRLASASFDVKTVCATCSHRSRNQATLFPEAAKKDDECLNKKCFQQKTREHYQQLAKNMEKMGLKVVTSEKEMHTLKQGRNTVEISPDPDRVWEHPKKYKSMCAKCETRALFSYETQHGGFTSGELCLNKKCFNEMNGKRDLSTSHSSRPPRAEHRASQRHALAMRNRFLRARLPEKVVVSETMQLRFMLFHVLCGFDRFSMIEKTELKKDHDQVMAELIREFCPVWKTTSILDKDRLYAAIATIPSKGVAAVLRKVILASIVYTDEDVLLQAMPEAGLTLEKNFAIDEQFLNSKTKDELVDMAVKKFGLPASCARLDMKKTEIMKGILKHNLVGKVPAEVTKECRMITFGKAGKK